MNLTKADLKAAHARKDWQTLWLAAMPLVKLAMRRLMERGYLDPSHSSEDLLQDAAVAAGETVRLWDPAKGAFSTWVMLRVTEKVRNSAQAANTGMIGGRQNGLPVVSLQELASEENCLDEDGILECGQEESLVYADPPEGFGSPEEAAIKQDQAELAAWIVASASPTDADLLQHIFGLGGVPQMPQAQYARHIGVLRSTVRWRLLNILQQLAPTPELSAKI